MDSLSSKKLTINSFSLSITVDLKKENRIEKLSKGLVAS